MPPITVNAIGVRSSAPSPRPRAIGRRPKTVVAVARLNAADVLDSSFGGDGKITKDFGEGPDEGWDLALQLDGKIIVVGSATIDGTVK